MSISEEPATSFGRVADSYDKVRPGPLPGAVDWLLPAGCQVAVDLAAGTGLFTRAIAARVPQVTAIEPDQRMRDVLARRSPGVRVLAGTAEEMPLPDCWADAVLVSTAWHWFDPERAVPEIARVLKDGGRLAIVWTSRDRDPDWVAELDILRNGEAPEPQAIAEVRAYLERHHSVTLPAGAQFGTPEVTSFSSSRTLSVPDTLDWVATNSRFITAPPEDREARLVRLRAALVKRSGDSGLVDMPVRSWCWRATRLPRC
ncbi:MAG TPA: class I SAM-dependent methyltransferase [Trebonia sp.]|nr:class I SAM-dependent methyltransferase [Trebonia sp.]